MIISLIAAMAENRVIGCKSSIPWHIPAEQKRFQEITLGHPVVFGRITFEIIGRPLSGRTNIVLSHHLDYRPSGAAAAHSLEEAFALCGGADEAFICGGGMVFRETISLAQRIYLTIIHKNYEGDTFFPEIPDGFVEAAREEVEDAPSYSLVCYERAGNG